MPAPISDRPLFQRRQYEYLASILADVRASLDDRIDPHGRARLDAYLELFADRLASTNLHFNRTRFLDACRQGSTDGPTPTPRSLRRASGRLRAR